MSEAAGPTYGLDPSALGRLGSRLRKSKGADPLKAATPQNAYPFGAQEVEIARENFLRAHATPKAALVLQKAINLLLVILVLVLGYTTAKLYRRLGDMKPLVVRVNDVGRAEAVRVDYDYIPEEPELRDALERLAVRMFTRNGFAIPEAIETMPLYLTEPLYKPWLEEVKVALLKAAEGKGLRRVRILGCRIDQPARAKQDGTSAQIRFATDDTSAIGTPLPHTAEGYEVNLHFKIGVYPTSHRNQFEKDLWLVRNPLGLKVDGMSVARYIGKDVQDVQLDRIWTEERQKANDQKGVNRIDPLLRGEPTPQQPAQYPNRP